jgi:thiamine monophosphate synthase
MPGASQQARVAAIDAVFGKYAHLGVSVDDLHRERQADKIGEDWAAKGEPE